MRPPIVIIGIGQLGGTFARGLLRCGHPVYPVTRDMNMAEEAAVLPAPASVLVAVAEQDLHAALDALPPTWREQAALLQNELLPRDWQRHELARPTVLSIWFEKKKGTDTTVLLPTPAWGPHAQLFCEALRAVDIPARELAGEDELTHELVRKNVYILTINIAGLVVGGTVEALWRDHQALACDVANEVMDVQFRLIGRELPRERLIEGMLEAFAGDPAHKCLGRTAPDRLRRAIAHADEFDLAVPTLRRIAAQI